MSSTTISATRKRRTRAASPSLSPDSGPRRVLIACPDSRPPAYQAAIALAESGRLHQFITAFYYGGHGPISELARKYFPCQFIQWRKVLKRRHERRIPSERVVGAAWYDAAIALETRLARRFPKLADAISRGKYRWFDRQVARAVARHKPDLVYVFSDVGSEFTLALCRKLGIPTILSMVTGDVREEQRLLDNEARLAPDYFPLYLGGATLDRDAMAFLHDRRLREIAQADLLLVPSDHIAGELIRHGTEPERIQVVPYAADTARFKPAASEHRTGTDCNFLFAGGIAQRKGIKYLFDAWDRVRRPGLRLQLLGGLPRELGPLADRLGQAEHLGRVGHADVPSKMAAADVFVFPSLFEGSAVVTYEALASGLPCIVTPQAGSVVRDGIEGFVVDPRDVEGLADRMRLLADDPDLRRKMSEAARERALSFDWPRYHTSVNQAVLQAASLDRA